MSQNIPTQTPPETILSRRIDLNDLTHAGSVFELSADADTAATLAQWAEVVAIRAFRAQVTVKRLADARFFFQAAVEADIEQTCVVSLEPVFTHIACTLQRELHYVGGHVRKDDEQNHGELTLSSGDEEAPDVIDSLQFDIATPVLEEFLLAIDPYPRKTGATFEGEKVNDPPESPFAALKAWKKNDET